MAPPMSDASDAIFATWSWVSGEPLDNCCEQRQLGGQQRDPLAELVMQLARQADPLLLVRVDQLPAELAQFLLGLPALRDVAARIQPGPAA